MQRQGVGTTLVRDILSAAGDRRLLIHAQAHLERWYASLGFRRQGDTFMEAEIPHVIMVH